MNTLLLNPSAGGDLTRSRPAHMNRYMTASPAPHTPLSIPDSYLAMIRNSVGSTQYRTLIGMVDGMAQDLTQRGRLSCGLFVSSILHQFNLIKEPHATIEGCHRDMETSGWTRIRKPKPGCILVWEEDASHGSGLHRHIGFYVGNDRAISNSSKLKRVVRHHWTFGARDGKPIRKIQTMWWHEKLGR